MAHGWNTTSYQILNPGIKLWFASTAKAVIGYASCGSRRVVAGAPICDERDLDTVLNEWHRESADAGQVVCYFGAEERLASHLVNSAEYSSVVLGAQPVWLPEHFVSGPKRDKALRYQLSRARNKGVEVVEWPSSRATGNGDLKRILEEWLQSRGLPPMHFMVEPYTLDCLEDRRLFVALVRERPVAFVVLTPVPERRGWLTEQFVRGREAPNGTIELLLNHAVNLVCDSGSSFVTMGIVPLSSHGAGEAGRNPKWLRLLLTWFRAHGRRFYNFDGLDAFKSKFHPDFWEPIYAISREPSFSVATLHAIALAFSQKSPVVAVMEGLGRALRQELAWVRTRALPEG